jgi:hypothetical protein
LEFAAGSRNVSVFIPTMSSGTDILFKVSADNSTFHSLKYSPTSGVVAVGNVTVGSAVTQCAIRIPELAGQRYVKTELGTALDAAAGHTFYYVVEY